MKYDAKGPKKGVFCIQISCFEFLVKSRQYIGHWCVKQILENENDDGGGNVSGWEDVCLFVCPPGSLMVTFNFWLKLATNVIFQKYKNTW